MPLDAPMMRLVLPVTLLHWTCFQNFRQHLLLWSFFARVDRSVDATQEARKRCCLLEISALKHFVKFVTRILKIGKRFSGAWDDKPMG